MSRLKELISGVKYIFKGFKVLIANPKLWPWALLPTLINLILLALMLATFFHFLGDIYSWLSAHILQLGIENPTTWYLHILDSILWAINLLFQIIIFLLSLIFVLIISYVLGLIVAAPFNDALSERVELLVTNKELPSYSFKKMIKDLLRTIKMETIKGLVLILIPVLLFVLNIIPIIGGILYVALTFIFGAWDLGFAYADLPMGRKVIPLKNRISFASKNKWGLIGLGAGFIIPFFNLVFAAPMVVAGTLFYCDKHEEDQ